MFSDEYEYLIHLIYSAIHNLQPTPNCENVSLEKVFEIAKEHEVANISFVAIEKMQNNVDGELYKKWKTQYAFSIQRNINQQVARDVIVCELNKNHIRNTELQGTVIKKLYPYAFWRNMSDIDFVVDKQNLLKTEKVLRELGYTTKCYHNDLSAYTNPKIAVEIHTDFFDTNTEFYGKITNPFKNATKINNDFSYTASEEDIFIYNILHCIKHYRGKGAGIRRIIDIYYLNKKILPKLDKTAVQKLLKQLNCKKDYEILSAIAEQWLDLNGKECDFYYEKNKIFMSQTHGNVSISVLNAYEYDENKKLFKIKKIIKLLFPSKENIYSAYSVCAQKRLPTVICWIYRWCCLVFKKDKRKHTRNILKRIISFNYKKFQP